MYMSKFCNLLILLIGFVIALAFASQLAVGDAIPAITANDQHGVPFVLTTNIQTLLIATEMDCSKAANRQLAAQAAAFLDNHNAAFLIDIHSMPGIARWFAIRCLTQQFFSSLPNTFAKAATSFRLCSMIC